MRLDDKAKPTEAVNDGGHSCIFYLCDVKFFQAIQKRREDGGHLRLKSVT